MIVPLLAAGMKESHDLACGGINAREIGTFLKIAMVAGQGKIIRLVASPMLPGNDMFDVKAVIRLLVLV